MFIVKKIYHKISGNWGKTILTTIGIGILLQIIAVTFQIQLLMMVGTIILALGFILGIVTMIGNEIDTDY